MKWKHIILKNSNTVNNFNELKGILLTKYKRLVTDEEVIKYLLGVKNEFE
jgi:hypothetical protein